MKILVIFLVLLIAGVAGYSWVSLHWSYSTGERAGFVQKLSKERLGLQDLGGRDGNGDDCPGTVSEKFLFHRAQRCGGRQDQCQPRKRVAVHFEQHKWLPSSCFGDTEYFVTAMQLTE